MNISRYNADTGLLTIYSREDGETSLLDLPCDIATSHKIQHVCSTLYKQGLDQGERNVTNRVRLCLEWRTQDE